MASDFYKSVYDVVRRIPEGRATSYGAIANYLGGSPRVVGYAMNNCHNIEDVPAHRVVNRNGMLTGKHHFPGTNLMQQLLENEGLTIKDDKIQDWKSIFWDPEKNLENNEGRP